MIDINDVSFVYGEESDNGGVYNINLHIDRGEFIVLTGVSGCGKTTITRIINGLIPNYYEGQLSGEIRIDNEDMSSKSISQISRKVASVFQNPRSQFFSADSTGELAFQMENRGEDPQKIINKINDIVREFKIESLMGRSLFEMSGGEKQKLACAGVALANADIIVLDEPSSNLDVYSIEELKKTLMKWKEQKKTVIISEHRLYYLKELLDRMLLMENGKIVKEFTHDEAVKLTKDDLNGLGLRTLSLDELELDSNSVDTSNESFDIIPFSFYYKNSSTGIDIDSVKIPKKSIIAVVGHNGAGKSTFARCICGLDKKCKVIVKDRDKMLKNKQLLNECFMVMQDVNYQLFTESVADEVIISLSDYKKLDDDEREDKAKGILDAIHMKEYSDIHPMALSGGQKQRVAIASAILADKEILIFDEPTSGLDFRHMEQTAKLLSSLREKKTVFIVTHDTELIKRCCSYVLHIEEGEVYNCYQVDK